MIPIVITNNTKKSFQYAGNYLITATEPTTETSCISNVSQDKDNVQHIVPIINLQWPCLMCRVQVCTKRILESAIRTPFRAWECLAVFMCR
jgi:hypothetical protein